ncbi:hypothetical protein [Microbacterium testaceum]|uniref:hypothetical protein n=1 Tax=Microbacterium testaceum TaxID=2033 RepID=UPI002AC5A52A|nr:hypothetical protein [Microbacterium testaceum]MDZ5146376.1 hypothetical protein [Microbacterium testaceum]
MGRVEWARIDDATFNALSESLLVREYTGNGLVAMAIDGRGGDGGIDVDVRVARTDQVVHVFQLKYFPEGFSGGHVARRAQIKKSMSQAIETVNPPVWSLVVPRKVTVQERKAVRAMRKGHRMIVRFVTPVELDLLLAKYPDIEERFTADRAIELLSAVHRPSATLTKPSDLHDEVRRVEGRLNARSEYWGTSFSLGPDGTYVETLHPKRPDAPEREPLGLALTASFSPDDADLRQRFERALKFGVMEPIVLPGTVVESLQKTGPAWFEEKIEHANIEIRSLDVPHESERVKVDVLNPAGRSIARLTGATTATSSGYGGVVLHTLLEGGVHQRWTLPSDPSESGSVTTSAQFVGSTAHEIRRALRFWSALQNATTLELSVGSEAPTRLNYEATPTDPDLQFESFIEDLCFLENHFDVPLRLPESVDTSDVVWARVMRLLASGEATAHPFTGTFSGILDGSRDPGLETLLGDGAAIVARSEQFGVEMFGEELVLADIAYYAHGARIDEPDLVRAAFERGTARNMRVEIRPVDGLPWVIYSPGLLEAAGHDVVVTKPWGLRGVDERSGYDRLPNREGNQGGRGGTHRHA